MIRIFIISFLLQAFATGTALAVSVLDSIVSTAYYNHQALTLIKSLISGNSAFISINESNRMILLLYQKNTWSTDPNLTVYL